MKKWFDKALFTKRNFFANICRFKLRTFYNCKTCFLKMKARTKNIKSGMALPKGLGWFPPSPYFGSSKAKAIRQPWVPHYFFCKIGSKYLLEGPKRNYLHGPSILKNVTPSLHIRLFKTQWLWLIQILIKSHFITKNLLSLNGNEYHIRDGVT